MMSLLQRLPLLGLLALGGACASAPSPEASNRPAALAGLEYLKELKGRWVVQSGTEGPLGWEFDVTSRGGVVTERLKMGVETEMASVYHLLDDELVLAHFCQLGNQPRLTRTDSELPGDLHFLCDGEVPSASSHGDLHMHGVHFQRTGDRLRVWMDMYKDDVFAFETSYEMIRAE